MSLNSTPRTWVAGEIVTAGLLNTEIRDAVAGIESAWDAYTPVWSTTGTAPSLGNGTLLGYYQRIGKTVHFSIKLTAGSTTTFGTGTLIVNLPFTPKSGSKPRLSVYLNDVSAGTYFVGNTFDVSVSNVSMGVHTTSAFLVAVSGTVPFTGAVNDSYEVYGTYEAS